MRQSRNDLISSFSFDSSLGNRKKPLRTSPPRLPNNCDNLRHASFPQTHFCDGFPRPTDIFFDPKDEEATGAVDGDHDIDEVC